MALTVEEPSRNIALTASLTAFGPEELGPQEAGLAWKHAMPQENPSSSSQASQEWIDRTSLELSMATAAVSAEYRHVQKIGNMEHI